MNKILIVATLSIIFFLCGCPHEGNFSISDVGVPIDKNLVGKWICFEGSFKYKFFDKVKDESSAKVKEEYLLIADFNGKEFYTEWNYFAKDNTKEKSRMRGFVSKFLEDNYMNLQSLNHPEESAKNRPYIFAKYRLASDGRLVVQLVKGDSKGGTSYKNRKSFLLDLKKMSKEKEYLEPKVVFYKEYTKQTTADFHDNGEKKSEGFWKDGEKHGIWTGWDDSGKVISKEIFLRNVAVKNLLPASTKKSRK